MATPAGADVDVSAGIDGVVTRLDGPGRGLDGLDSRVETAGGRVDGALVVEGSAAAVAASSGWVAGWVAVVMDVGGPWGLGTTAPGAGFEAGAPALTVVEAWRLRS